MTALFITGALITPMPAQEIPATWPKRYLGCPEVSAAVALGDQHFIAAGDEDNALRVYELANPKPIAVIDFGRHLVSAKDKDPDQQKVDIEGATWLGELCFWIGSHSRTTDKGKLRPSRFRLFAISAHPKTPTTLTFKGQWRHLLRDLGKADETWKLGLAKAFGPLSAKTHKPGPKDPGGFNIEGLAASPDQKTLLIGLRNPLSAGKAIIISLLNAPALISGTETEARFADPITLDLAGFGIRSLEYSPKQRAYLIIANSIGSDNTVPFRLYLWSGNRADPPRQHPHKVEASFNPEALILYPQQSQAQIFSDEGRAASDDGFRCRWLTLP